ncbi:MAG TPA: PASTA domain-containing protein [Saprospiraceae bacterium]|nr:PASTA domain-containing protein [Saprospiraceae bacterium]
MHKSAFVLQDKRFWRHIGLVLIALVLCLLLTFMWLRRYTRHGQRLELPDYTGQILEEAMKDARSRSFRMVVMDSVYLVGKRGHEIIRQNPLPNSLVKEKRTLYVTVTKYAADKIPLSRLPSLYGKNFERKKTELKQGFEIRAEIVGRQYDPGEPDHILAVVYQGDTIIDRKKRGGDVMIEKGSTLGFILSQRTGGRLPIPNLICMTYAEAQFLLENSGLEISEVIQEDPIVDLRSAYVSGQVPDADQGTIEQGSSMKLSLTREKPQHCQ